MLAAAVAALANMLLGSLDAADKGETGPEPKTIRRQAALEEINTLAQEFAPTFSPDGKTMVFSSTRSSGKGGFSHLYVSHLKDGKWGAPEPLHSVNSQFNDETPYLSNDGKILLFASDRDGSLELPRDAKGQVRVSFDIYLAQWDGKTWSNPRPVQEINTPWNEKSPSISRDGRYLFFSSWPFGDMKRSRIRMLDLQAKGNVIDDLPPHINSGNQETALVPGEDNTRYYFSSRRPGGKGGWDIWQTRFSDGKWAEPEPVPGNVNTEGNEAFLAVSQGNYFISSTFNAEKPDYDLNIEPIKPEAAKQWNVQLIDASTRQKLTGTVKLEVLEADSDKKSSHSTQGSGNGIVFKAPVSVGGEEVVRLNGSAEGYLPGSEDTDTATLTEGTYLLPLRKLEKNASFDIRSIYFDFDSARIKKSSEPSLRMVLEFLKQNPKAEFEIIGHTDLAGDAEYNQSLSEKRAASVKTWLVENGIDKGRLTTSGAGKSRPVVAKRGKPFDEQNRRTEFKLK
ncbi:MAG TPA: OmpA family protein [Turneriella sp.]|nr:OmpA family protein [Turneriella sp.]